MELLISLVTVFANLILGLFTYLKNPKSSTNRLLAFLTLQVSVWAIANYFSLHSHTSDSTLFWIRMVMLITSPMGPTIFLLFRSFPNSHINLNKKYLYGILLLAISCCIFSISPFMFTSVTISNRGIQPVAGFGILIFEITAVGFLLMAMITIFEKYKKSIGLEKLQLKYLISGVAITFFSMIITNLFFVIILKVSSFVVFGPLLSLILVGFISYAIIKHRLLNIGLVVARSVTFFILISLILTAYTFVSFGISNLFFGAKVQVNQLIIYAILTLLISSTFHSLKNYLEKITEKIFFKNNYNSNELLSKLTKILAMNLRLEDITTKTINELFNTMHISRGSFFIFRDEDIIQSTSGGFGGPKIRDKKMILGLCKEKRILIFEEEDNEEKKEIMRKLDASIALPLYVENEINGILLLGEKKSGDIYFSKDIEILKIFGPEVSVAVENAKAYEEIRRFNITLKEKVERATKDLQKANSKLQEVDKLKDEFVSLASHELRTPMTVIKSYLWLMLDKNNVGALSEKQKMYIDRAYTSTQRLINLVNDMLNVSRIESGRFTLVMKPIDLGDLINTVYTEMLPKAQEQKVNLEFAKPLQPLLKVQADSERIEQVLINIIGNSLKFTPENGSIRISIDYDPKTQQETVSVVDNGKGISAEDVPKLFQKFSMVGTNYLVKQNAQGTGLGLYLSKSMVELMGGKIWAESEGLGKGSKFSFTLKTA